MRISRMLLASVALQFGACSADPDGTASGVLPFDAGTGASMGAAGAGGATGAAMAGGGGPGSGMSMAGGTAGAGAMVPIETGCQAHVVNPSRATPDMLIVLDRSGSMNPDSNDTGTDRWGGSRMALIEVTDSFDDKIRFGLMTFPGVRPRSDDDDDNENECAPGGLDVPVNFNTGPMIASTLQMMEADGRTPTAAALQAALPVISTAVSPDQTVPPRYVLLVTDGDPNCGEGSAGGRGGGGRDDAARMQTIRAIEALTAAGVKTYVVGYQTAGSDFVDQLDRMAAAGGTGDTTHRSVASGADLNMTLSTIAANVISCAYQLPMPASDTRNVLVRVGGRGRNLDNAADGFRIEKDKRTITLLGKACEEVQAGAIFAVEVTCEPVPLF
jgi:hypothetical protein